MTPHTHVMLTALVLIIADKTRDSTDGRYSF
jgi:hypothetical protein